MVDKIEEMKLDTQKVTDFDYKKKLYIDFGQVDNSRISLTIN